MKVRTICLVLSSELLSAEQEKIAKRPQTPNAAPMLEGHFMRCGHVFELHDMPRFNAGDMVLFTGMWGADARERRVRLHINIGYYDTTIETWFNVIVVVAPRNEHAQADWNHDGIASVMKENCKYTVLDLLEAPQAVCNAAIIGWDQATSRPFMPIVLMGRAPEPGAEDEPPDQTGESGTKPG